MRLDTRARRLTTLLTDCCCIFLSVIKWMMNYPMRKGLFNRRRRMKVYLLDINPEMIEAWKAYFCDEEKVQVVHAAFDTFMRE